MNSALRFSVVVPVPGVDVPCPVVSDLAAIAAVRGDMEILVATGARPSRQRNLAAGMARGEILVFLDSDCRVQANHLEKIFDHMKAGREVVGGPVLLHSPATPQEHVFQSFFSHPVLTGRCSARYRASGLMRESDDAELILCNMAVRRETFFAIGGFEERLYPNEENEWMDRLEATGRVPWYDPELSVSRPQRKNWREFACTMIGYGQGRTRQFFVSHRFDLFRQAPAVGLILFLLAFIFRPWAVSVAGFFGWMGYAMVVRRTSMDRPQISLMAALQAPLLPLLYAAGQVWGFIDRVERNSFGDVQVYRWNDGSLKLLQIDNGYDRT